MKSFGFDEAAQDAEQAVTKANNIRAIYAKSAKKVEDRTKAIAQSKGLVKTGAGISGIQFEADDNGFKGGWAGRPELHLWFHEVGTYKDPSKPHLRPAVDETEQEVYKEIQENL